MRTIVLEDVLILEQLIVDYLNLLFTMKMYRISNILSFATIAFDDELFSSVLSHEVKILRLCM